MDMIKLPLISTGCSHSEYLSIRKPAGGDCGQELKSIGLRRRDHVDETRLGGYMLSLARRSSLIHGSRNVLALAPSSLLPLPS